MGKDIKTSMLSQLTRQFNEEELKTWKPRYVIYDRIYLAIVILTLCCFIVDQWVFSLPAVWTDLIGFICLGYFPFIWWQIKTGYLSTAIFIPKGLIKYNIKAVSRKWSPFLFWICILSQTIVFSVLAALLLYLKYSKI